MELNVLAVGDVVAPSGLAFLEDCLPYLRRKYEVGFCAVNGENAMMVGLKPEQAERMLDAGADVITLGNHTWNRREIIPYLKECSHILRPANFPPQLPGRGWGTYDTPAGPVMMVSLIGRCGMNFGPDNPFLLAERLAAERKGKPLLVDMHAEATSEKLAMGYMLDGTAAAVWGTHTHVPTADCQILPKGTGYITDLGMTGPACSILGVRPEQSVANFRGDLTSRYEAAPGPCELEGALFRIDMETGLCVHAERVEEYD